MSSLAGSAKAAYASGRAVEPSRHVMHAAATAFGVEPASIALAPASASAASISAPVRASLDRGRWTLAGVAGPSPWAATASRVLVLASVEIAGTEHPALFVVDVSAPGVQCRGCRLVGHREAGVFELADAEAVLVTHDGGVIAEGLDRATLVAAAELAGVARGALDLAVAYASTREQFGAPIATYQALAHRLVDMAIDAEAAELAVEEAVAAPTPRNVSTAKVTANEAAKRIAAGLHQIHGGVGFYADQAPPAYYARAWGLSVEMGDSAAHRRRLAALDGRPGVSFFNHDPPSGSFR